MHLDFFRDYCLNKKGVTETYPFDEQTMVFKVMGKMFAATDWEEFGSINLKVDPEKGAELRERYPAILPGYHMNKKHWITILMDGSLGDGFLTTLIDDSYLLVINGLSKKDKATLSNM